MNRQLPGFDAPAAGPESPLEMLSACHERIDRHCAIARRVAAHLAAGGALDPARDAAARVVRYFDSAGRDHHADEEQDLFPALLESMAGSDAVCLRAIVAHLTHEHRELERLWQRVREPLARIAAGADVDAAAALPVAAVDALAERYAAHIAREESELLPMAARLLADDALARLGAAMSARRGLGPGRAQREGAEPGEPGAAAGGTIGP